MKQLTQPTAPCRNCA